MTKRHMLAFGAAALALAGCGGAADNASTAASGNGTAAAAVAPPPGGDWTQVVSQTPEGGYVMGNPNAPVKLVEYLSLTCPHCAEFTEAASEPLRENYIKKGTVSLEIRNYVRDPIDVTASLITRCQGPEAYFSMTEQALAQQDQLFERAQGLGQAEAQRISALPPGQQFQQLAGVLGLDQFARQRGIPEQKVAACLADQAALDKLVAMQKYANETAQIPGTPAFFLNGELLQNAGTWQTLEPQLKAAGA